MWCREGTRGLGNSQRANIKEFGKIVEKFSQENSVIWFVFKKKKIFQAIVWRMDFKKYKTRSSKIITVET